MKNKIAFTGYAGSGKDWVARKIRSINGGGTRFAFADELKKDLAKLIGIEDQWEKLLYSEDFKQGQYMSFDNYKLHSLRELAERGYSLKTAADLSKQENGPLVTDAIQIRELMVYYGTYVMQDKLGKGVWVQRVFNSREYQKAKGLITITDLRFPLEYEKCREQGFKIVRVISDSDIIAKNIAESYIDQFEFDYTIKNSRLDISGLEIKKLYDWMLHD